MIRSGDILHNPVTGETLHFITSASDTNGEYVLLEAVIEPDGFVAAAHMHPFQTEVFEVLEGTIEFKAGGKEIVAGAGDTVVVEPGTAHKFRNAGDTPARFRCEVQAGSPVRAADRDDVRARERRQDESQGHAEPGPTRGDCEAPLRRRAASLPSGLHAAAGARPRGAGRPSPRVRPDVRGRRALGGGARHLSQSTWRVRKGPAAGPFRVDQVELPRCVEPRQKTAAAAAASATRLRRPIARSHRRMCRM